MLLSLLLSLSLALPQDDPWEGFECTGYGACEGDPLICWDWMECVEVDVFRDGFD